MDWRVKQALQEIGLQSCWPCSSCPLLGPSSARLALWRASGMCQHITGLRPVAKHEVVTEEGVLSVDEGWYVRQWNSSPREVSQEEWEGIEVGEKFSG